MKKVMLIALTLSITAPFLFAELNKAKTFGAEVYDAEGQATKAEALSVKIYGIYFSAHWCPPCRAFSPELVDVYKKINRKPLEEGVKNFEIIFVSSDRSEQAQFEYMEELGNALVYNQAGSERGQSTQ